MQLRMQIMWSGPSMVRSCGRSVLYGCALVIHHLAWSFALTTSVLTTSEEVLALCRWAPDGSRQAFLIVHTVLLASRHWLSAWWLCTLHNRYDISSE